MGQPVAIIAYNRPQYLFSCLTSLEQQCKGRDVYLFLDGERGPQEKSLVDDSEDLFKEIFPNGNCERSEYNLGVAFNTKRAREYMFNLYESAVFIEDDLVLNSFYMEIMDALMDRFKKEDKVAMVSAYGGNTTRKLGAHSLEDQIRNKNKLVTMDHILGYGAWRNKFEVIKPLLQQYYDLLPSEYRYRPHAEILKFWQSKGVRNSMTTTSQDAATVMSMLLNKQIKLSTYANNLLYIGEWGEHSRPADFERYQWDQWPVMDEMVTDYEYNEEVYEFTLKELEERYIKDGQ
tara:strand:+ start:7186 stop:8055 length:870 start_codon:yes stop_codon:yes gene_type:complete